MTDRASMEEAGMTDRITQLPAPPEASDDPAHTIEALNDQLRDQAIELDMLREALGVPYEPHQSLLERMLEAARGRAGSGAAPEPPAQEPMPGDSIDPYAKYRDEIRAKGMTATPFRLGIAVGYAGAGLPSPYPKGAKGDQLYRDGLEFGRLKRAKEAARAALADGEEN